LSEVAAYLPVAKPLASNSTAPAFAPAGMTYMRYWPIALPAALLVTLQPSAVCCPPFVRAARVEPFVSGALNVVPVDWPRAGARGGEEGGGQHGRGRGHA
jgi:hypothetical protein